MKRDSEKNYNKNIVMIIFNIINYVSLCEKNDSNEIMNLLNEKYFTLIANFLDKWDCKYFTQAPDKIYGYWEFEKIYKKIDKLLYDVRNIINKNIDLNKKYKDNLRYYINAALINGDVDFINGIMMGKNVDLLYVACNESKNTNNKIAINSELCKIVKTNTILIKNLEKDSIYEVKYD